MDTPKNDKVSDFELELYKNLRAEISSTLAAIRGLWLQKFVLVGAAFGFVFTGNIKPTYALVEKLGVLLVPVLSVLIDCRILEHTLYARAASQFIGREYESLRVVAAWEAVLWDFRSRSYSLIRTMLSSVVTAVPTAGLIVVASAFMQHLLWGIIGVAIYIGAAVLVTVSLHQRSRRRTATPASDVT